MNGSRKESMSMDRKLLEEMASELVALELRVDRLRHLLSEALGRDLPSSKHALSPSPDGSDGDSGERKGNAGGVAAILDLSGDLKTVQLALLRKGQATMAELASSTGLDADEIRIYLKTLERQGTITRVAGTSAEPSYRAVLKKGHKAGSSSFLDKLG